MRVHFLAVAVVGVEGEDQVHVVETGRLLQTDLCGVGARDLELAEFLDDRGDREPHGAHHSGTLLVRHEHPHVLAGALVVDEREVMVGELGVLVTDGGELVLDLRDQLRAALLLP